MDVISDWSQVFPDSQQSVFLNSTFKPFASLPPFRQLYVWYSVYEHALLQRIKQVVQRLEGSFKEVSWTRIALEEVVLTQHKLLHWWQSNSEYQLT